MVGIAGVIGGGSSALAGAASADTQPQRTLTIEGLGSAAQYDFSVEGSVTKSTALGANINANDTISGSSVSGEVGIAKDSYAFTGELTSFSLNGDALLYLNGEPLSDTVIIEDIPEGRPTNYELSVDGEVLKSTAMSATINSSDEITPRDNPDEIEQNMLSGEPLAGETFVLGEVSGGSDSYAISGDPTAFVADGNVNVYLNGEVVTPGNFRRNTLTLEGTGPRASYEFSVSEGLRKSTWMGANINSNDTISDGTASGVVGSGRDSYAFTGEITEFSADDSITVYLNSEEIDAATLSREPQFENTLTIEGLSGSTSYELAVEGDLEANYGIAGDDIIEGSIANGSVTSGQDSYTFSGDISSFDSDTSGSFKTYLNGNEVDPETLGATQTTPDADQLPNEVSIRALTDERVEYGIGVSGALSTGDRSNTYSGDNAAYEYARGWVKGEGLDNYKYSGRIGTITDFDNIQIDINDEEGQIVISNTGKYEKIGYEIEVTGGLTPYQTDSNDTTEVKSATGYVNKGTDVYGYSGKIDSIIIKNKIKVETSRYGDDMPNGALIFPKTKAKQTDQTTISPPDYMSSNQTPTTTENTGESVPGLFSHSNYTAYGKAKLNNGVQKMYAKWKVPKRPPKYKSANPVFFYFDGLISRSNNLGAILDTESSALVQPVLEWNRSSDSTSQWTLSSWWVVNKKKNDNSDRIPASSGDMVEGYMEYNKHSGTWNVTTRNLTTGRATGIMTPDFSSRTFDIAYCALENVNWNGFSCDFLPDGTVFKKIFVEDMNGNRYFPTFYGNVKYTTCAEVKALTQDKRVEIQTRGPIF